MCVINRQNIILKYAMRGHFRYTSRLVQNLGPLPDAEFVVSNRPTERPGVPMTTATKARKQATTKKKKTTKQGAHGGDKQNQPKKKKSTKKVAVK